MRLALNNRVPAEYNRQAIQSIINDLQTQLNNLSEGVLTATNNAVASVPTTGSYNVGDFVKNSAPSELGGAGSKYIQLGWICTSSPTTFLEVRTLTGN